MVRVVTLGIVTDVIRDRIFRCRYYHFQLLSLVPLLERVAFSIHIRDKLYPKGVEATHGPLSFMHRQLSHRLSFNLSNYPFGVDSLCSRVCIRVEYGPIPILTILDFESKSALGIFSYRDFLFQSLTWSELMLTIQKL